LELNAFGVSGDGDHLRQFIHLQSYQGGADGEGHYGSIVGGLTTIKYGLFSHGALASFAQIPHLRGLWAPDNSYQGTDAAQSVVDRSGGGRDLSIGGSVSFANYQNGNYPEMPYAEIAAGANYLYRADEAAFGITQFLTVGGWWWFDDTDATYVFMSQWGSAGQRGWEVYAATDDALHAAMTNDGTNTGAATSIASAVTTGQWLFVVMRFTASAELALFVGDGEDLSKGTDTSSVPASIHNSTSQYRYMRSGDGSFSFDGRMGIQFLSAAAVDDTTIEGLYQGSRGYYGV
jgi:hypothetical protein